MTPRWGTAQDAAPGEVTCGDRVLLRPADPADAAAGCWLAVVDGLGHGELAARAADRALAALEEAWQEAPAAADPRALLARLDQALVATRGAAVGLAHLQPQPGGARLRHAGVGNTRCLRWRDGHVLRLPSRYGVVGDGALGATLAADDALQVLDLLAGDVLLLFTDGLDENLQLSELPAGWRQDPQRLARHLLSRWRQVRDDAAVLACLV